MATLLKNEAYRLIRKEVIEGQWPEDRVLSTVRLAKACGTSLGPVREAITQLETEGLVEKVENRGIRPRRLSLDELKQMFELRLFLESGAAELAAERITQNQIQRLTDTIMEHRSILHEVRQRVQTGQASEEESFQSGYFQKAGELNVKFHLTVIEASENLQMMKLISDLHILSRLLRGWLIPAGETYLGRNLRDLRFHHQILHGLKQHDPSLASQAMRRHLRDAMIHHIKAHDLYIKIKEGHGAWSTTYLQNVSEMETRISKEHKSASDTNSL